VFSIYAADADMDSSTPIFSIAENGNMTFSDPTTLTGVTPTTAGDGADIAISCGGGYSSGAGGVVTINGGVGAGTSVGGGIILQAGTSGSGATGNGVLSTLYRVRQARLTGLAVLLQSSAGWQGTGASGALSITTGSSGAGSGADAGDITITGATRQQLRVLAMAAP